MAIWIYADKADSFDVHLVEEQVMPDNMSMRFLDKPKTMYRQNDWKVEV